MRWVLASLLKHFGILPVMIFALLACMAVGQKQASSYAVIPGRLVYFNSTASKPRVLENFADNSTLQTETNNSNNADSNHLAKHYNKGSLRRIRIRKSQFTTEKNARRQGQQCAGVCNYIPDRDFCPTDVVPEPEEYEAYDYDEYDDYNSEERSEESSEEYSYDDDEYEDDYDYKKVAGKRGNKRLTEGKHQSEKLQKKRAQQPKNSTKPLHVVFPPLTRYAASRGVVQKIHNGRNGKVRYAQAQRNTGKLAKGRRRRKKPNVAQQVKQRPQALEQEILIRWDRAVERGPYIGGDIVIPEGALSRPPNFRFLRKQWPDGEIPFTMDPSLNTCRQNAIYDAMDEIEGRTCIRFVERDRERNYIDIRRAQIGCSSYVGMVGGAQHLNLSTGCFSKFTVTHELMHAIGFDHEQSRRDRDKFIDIDFDNVLNAKEGQFELNPTFTGVGFPYDIRSIMHYSAFLFAKDKCEPTIYPVDERIDICELGIGNGKGGMTNCDAAKINKMYKCKGKKFAKSCKTR